MTLSRHGRLLSEESQGRVLGPNPILFNIFINDLFYHIKRAKLNAYAGDHQIYYSDRDPVALEVCLCKEVETANQWYNENGIIVNETKHQALILGDTMYAFSFSVKESIDIFGMTLTTNFSLTDTYPWYAKKSIIS